jgi:glycosyltransferase involved in cell wall biosynthesis
LSSNVKLVGISFGDPKSESTYSGVPKYLFNAVEKKAELVACLNTRRLRPWDVFDGVLDFSRITAHGKVIINVNWLWRRKTIDKLSSRFGHQLSKVNGYDAVLQVGTHVYTTDDRIKHYCRTDMTVLQAIEARQFHMGEIKKEWIAEAIESQRVIFESCKGVFVASNWTKRSIVADYGISADKIHVIKVGASVALDIDINNKEPNHNILFIGRDWERKGGNILLDAFKRVRQCLPDAKLTIIGCSPRISGSNVEVLGYLDKKRQEQKHDINNAMMNASVLCVPSRYEPLGICFMEAQFCGVIPVTFSGEGREDAMIDGVTGILLDDRKPDVLADVLIDLLKNPERVRKMSAAGYEYARNNFTWDHVATKVLDIIKEGL